jgi:cytidylate kinase
MGINIAIDGTAGSGKGTISNGISKALGFYHLDTGAMFRMVAYKCVKEGIDFHNEEKICKLIKGIDFKIVFEKDCNGIQIQKNILDGEDLGQKIRTEKISEGSSIVSQYVCVRDYTS